MSSRDAYGGAHHCLKCARDETDAVMRRTWVQKAIVWRDLARMLRRRGK